MPGGAARPATSGATLVTTAVNVAASDLAGRPALSPSSTQVTPGQSAAPSAIASGAATSTTPAGAHPTATPPHTSPLPRPRSSSMVHVKRSPAAGATAVNGGGTAGTTNTAVALGDSRPSLTGAPAPEFSFGGAQPAALADASKADTAAPSTVAAPVFDFGGSPAQQPEKKAAAPVFKFS